MNENKNQLDKVWNQLEHAKKEFTKIIIEGLSDSDPREVSLTCQIIQKELFPALELDKAESKKLSLNTLNKLVNEKRPPKNDHELNDLENAAFFKLVNDIQKEKITNKTDVNEKFFKLKNTSIEELKKQYKGRKFGDLILHHLKVQNSNQINDAVIGLKRKINPALKETTEKFLETIIYGFAKSKDFWKADCGEALMLYTNSTKAEAKKYNIEVNDDYTFDIFNLIVLSLAQKASLDSGFKKFIKKSVKRFGIF